MSAKIEKTLARQKEKIAEGSFYEAHQQLRVIASRYLKSTPPNFAAAASLLSSGAILLLKAGQGGSGGDLALMLVSDVYVRGEFEVSQDENRQRLIEILHAYPPGEPTRKRFVQEIVGWSARFGEGENERGDALIQDAVGAVYADEGEAYDAERHLLLGTSKSAPILAQLHYKWYTTDSPHLAALYASRSVLPYLVLGNLPSAATALSTFTSALTSANPTLFTQSIESAKSSIRVFPSLPLLNFLALLVLAVQKGDSGLFKQLAKHYTVHLKEIEDIWGEALANIGEIWFGIRIPRQGGNPLFDMMGSMLFGGGAPKPAATPRSSTPKPKAEPKKVEPAPAAAPPTMDLD